MKFLENKKVLILLSAVLIMTGVIALAAGDAGGASGKNDCSDNLDRLKNSIEGQDTAEADRLIKEAHKRADADLESSDVSRIFAGSVLIGDSMAEGVKDYGILDSSSVCALRGRRLDNSDDLFNQAIAKNPDNVFIEFGLNDIGIYNGRTEPFIEEYTSVIHKMKKALPDAKIYIVSFQRLLPECTSRNPSLKNWQGYNEAMKKLAEKEDVNYLDTTGLITSLSQYEGDYIHPREPYYTNWVKMMCYEIMEGR